MNGRQEINTQSFELVTAEAADTSDGQRGPGLRPGGYDVGNQRGARYGGGRLQFVGQGADAEGGKGGAMRAAGHCARGRTEGVTNVVGSVSARNGPAIVRQHSHNDFARQQSGGGFLNAPRPSGVTGDFRAGGFDCGVESGFAELHRVSFRYVQLTGVSVAFTL